MHRRKALDCVDRLLIDLACSVACGVLTATYSRPVFALLAAPRLKEAKLTMATRIKAKSLGWQLADDTAPEHFYHGDLATDAPAPQTELCRAIRDRISERLNGRIRDLDVTASGESIVISGRCASFHTKQLAQHAALDVMNEEPLDNRIQVYVP